MLMVEAAVEAVMVEIVEVIEKTQTTVIGGDRTFWGEGLGEKCQSFMICVKIGQNLIA